MVSGSQRNEGGRSLNSLFGSSETLQDNIKDLFWKLSQGSGDPGITVEAILRQVRQPGVNTNDETSAELISYLEKVGSLLTKNPVRLLARANDADSKETALQYRESSTQVYPVNTLLLAARFRQRQGANGNSNLESLPASNNVPLALPAPTVCTREETKQDITTSSLSSRMKDTTLCSEKQMLLPEDAVSADDGANVEDSCIESSRVQKQTTEVLREVEKRPVDEEVAIVEAEPKTEISALDSRMMAFCSLLVGSTVIATVGSLTRNDPPISTGHNDHCDLNSASSFDEHKKVSDEALIPLDNTQDLDLRPNVASTFKEVGTQHEEVTASNLAPCNVPALHKETKQSQSEGDPRFSDKHDTSNEICPSPKSVERRKIKVPENIESSIARALTSLRPDDDESTCEKKHFFNLEDNSYEEAVDAIHKQIGEFDYHPLKQKTSKEFFPSLPKYETYIPDVQSQFMQEVTHPSSSMEELQTLEEWRRCMRVEVKRRLERERTGPSKPDQSSLQSVASTTNKAEVPDLVTKHHNPSPKEVDKTSPKERTYVEDYGPCGSMQGKKRGHVEIQRVSHSRGRHEDKVEDNSRSRKKPKPHIAFGRRVYKSEKENKAQMDTKQQTTKNTPSERKRPRSVAIDPLYSNLNKVDVSGPEDSYSNGEDNFIDTLVNVLLSTSTTKFDDPVVQKSSVDFEVEDLHQVEDVMHAPMLGITNRRERNGMDNDDADHDFVEELVNLFPISDVVLSSQLNQTDSALATALEEGVIDSMDDDNRSLMRSSKKQTNSQEGDEGTQVVKGPATEMVIDSDESRAFKDQQNTSNSHPPSPQVPTAKEELTNAPPKDPVRPETKFLKETRSVQENSTEDVSNSQLQALDTIEQSKDDPDHQENLQKTQHLLRFDNSISETPTSLDENLPAIETESSASTSTSESTDPQHRMKDQRRWKDFKNRNLVQRRERLYTKHGIFDPLLFTSSEVETTSESDFSTCYVTKEATFLL